MASDKPKSSGKFLWIVAFIGAFIAVKEAKRWWFEQQAIEKAGATVEKQAEEMRQKGAEENPNNPSEGFRQQALKQTGEDLAKNSGEKKADVAAGQFIGYYMVNTQTRYRYCKSLGVDITPFVLAFKADNKVFYEKSRAIHSRGPTDPDKIENDLYMQLIPTFNKVVKDDMEGMAKEYKVTPKDICTAFNTSGKELAAELTLAKANPALYQAMVEAR